MLMLDIFKMGSWDHMGQIGNIIIEDIMNIFVSQSIRFE